MVKRSYRLEKGIKSIKEKIEAHFEKLDKDLSEEDKTLAEYHVKEIDKSLIAALEHKLSLLGGDAADIELVKRYKHLLEEYKKKLGIG